MGTNNSLIHLEEIIFGYPSRPNVLDKFSFTFSRGERVGLVGANGSGKTTLFHIIMGLLKPHDGKIEILGKQRDKESDFREVRERIGFLFQDADDQLFCPTVAEDIAFGPLNLGKTHDQAREIVRETLDILGLTGFEDRVTYNLSGGEKKLVSLATVIAMKPEVLLLDEPTTGLDEETTERIIDFLNSNSDFSYIIISHDREFLERTTQYIHRIKDGKMLDTVSSQGVIMKTGNTIRTVR
ncbi:MAG: ABC transporter ATP-binding protein [Thermodesulfobacteriota bacterium]|nr:ABC transporter ATP-binding protein [Thermodesulfobacteriota bacterium]